MAFMAAIPAALGSMAGGIGTALSVGGAIMGGVSAMQQAKYQAEVAKNNAKVAQDNANRETTATQQRILQSDNELAALAGEQLATQGASGLSTGGRTQFLTRKQTKTIGRQDALNINEQGTQTSRNYLQQAADFRSEANMAKSAGRNAMLQSVIGAAGSLVGTSKSTSSTSAMAMKNDPWVTRKTNMRVRTV